MIIVRQTHQVLFSPKLPILLLIIKIIVTLSRVLIFLSSRSLAHSRDSYHMFATMFTSSGRISLGD